MGHIETRERLQPIEELKSTILDYLNKGETNISYLNGEIPYVSEKRLRHMLLEAGYADYALGCMGWGVRLI